ncbi:hypothetical protein QQ054_32105 [Oscillatoria amoena NRMC-F 0135]|nr:hypothetical protein [Oscillatoria amoena NRMC-F 0135]
MSKETEIKPAQLPDGVAKKFKLNVTQGRHYIPSLGREVDFSTLDLETAKLIAEKHPKILRPIGKDEPDQTPRPGGK